MTESNRTVPRNDQRGLHTSFLLRLRDWSRWMLALTTLLLCLVTTGLLSLPRTHAQPFDPQPTSTPIVQGQKADSSSVFTAIGIPVVQGEQLPSELALPPTAYPLVRITQNVNYRSEPSARGGGESTVELLTPGTILATRTGEYALADADGKNTNTWLGASVVYLPSGQDADHTVQVAIPGYVAHGFFEEITDSADLPTAVQTLYERTIRLPNGPVKMIDELTDVFSQIENSAELDAMTAQAWGIEVISPTETSLLLEVAPDPLRVIQRVIVLAAAETIAEDYDGLDEGIINIAEIVDGKRDWSVWFQREDNYHLLVAPVQMLGYFLLARAQIDVDELNNPVVTVTDVAYASSPGVIQAFGKQSASLLARNVPDITAGNPPMLPSESGRVFLGGVNGGTFVQPLQLENGNTIEYEYADGAYRASEISATGERLRSSTYMQRGRLGAWVPTEMRPIESIDELSADTRKLLTSYTEPYADTIGMDSNEVLGSVTIRTVREFDGVPAVVIASENNVPLLIQRFDFDAGQYVWEKATLRTVFPMAGLTARIAGNVHQLDRYGSALEAVGGYSLPDGHWRDPNHPVPLRPDAARFDFGPYETGINSIVEQGLDLQFFHLIWGLQYALPEWLLDGNFTIEEYRDLAQDHIQNVMQHYKGQVHRYVVVNEAWGNPWDTKSRFWMDKLGDPSVWVYDMFKIAHETDPEATLILNDFGIEMSGSRLWIAQKESEFFDLVQLMRLEGLPVEAGFQLHLYSADFDDRSRFDQLIASFQSQVHKYITAGIPVSITEFDLFPDGVEPERLQELNGRIVAAIIGVCAEEGVQDITFFGTPGSEKKQPLFSLSTEPTPAYYASLSAVLEHISNQPRPAAVGVTLADESSATRFWLRNYVVDGHPYPDPQLLREAIKPYANAFGFSEEEVMDRLGYKIAELDGSDLLVEVFDEVTGVPLLAATVNSDEPQRELEYQLGMRKLVEIVGKRFGFFIDPSKRIEVDSASYLAEEADLIVPGAFAFTWLSTDHDTIIDGSRTYLPDRWIAFGRENRMHIRSGNYLVYESEFPEWLSKGAYSPQDFKDILFSRIEDTMLAFPEVDTWYVTNEVMKYFNSTRLYENTVAERVTGQEIVDLTFLVELYTHARSVADRIERETGKTIRLGLNDYTNLVTEKEGAFVLDNSVLGPKADFIFEIARELSQRELIDIVGLQFHFFQEDLPPREDLIAAVDRYDGTVEVEATEIDALSDDHYYDIVSALLETKALTGMSIWGVNDEGAWSPKDNFRYLFSNNEPTRAYYAVRRAYSDHIHHDVATRSLIIEE